MLTAALGTAPERSRFFCIALSHGCIHARFGAIGGACACGSAFCTRAIGPADSVLGDLLGGFLCAVFIGWHGDRTGANGGGKVPVCHLCHQFGRRCCGGNLDFPPYEPRTARLG